MEICIYDGSNEIFIVNYIKCVCDLSEDSYKRLWIDGQKHHLVFVCVRKDIKMKVREIYRITSFGISVKLLSVNSSGFVCGSRTNFKKSCWKYGTEMLSFSVCSQVFICVVACLSIANAGLLPGGNGGSGYSYSAPAPQDNGYNYPGPAQQSLPLPAPGKFIRNESILWLCEKKTRTIFELRPKQ